MKLFYTCGLFAILALTSWAKADYIEDTKPFVMICQQEVQTTNDELGNTFKNGRNPTDAIKCFFRCMMEKIGQLKNGELDEQGCIQNMQKNPFYKDNVELAKKAFAECKGVKGANECDTAFKISMCLKDKTAAMRFSPK